MSRESRHYRKEEPKSKFVQAVVIGAVVGGCLSLLDKSTRHSVKASTKQWCERINYLAKNPDRVIDQVREATTQMRTTVTKVSDEVALLVDTVEELSHIPSEVSQMIEETKEAFVAEKKKAGLSEQQVK
ncbi:MULTISPECIES: YtxH domain-containing protein [Peribacillus]|uniref:Uncharacterized protein n=1 Tax=Peribacillus asahii TaxID=228899 RepID=A0A3Q9RGX0_9BACI|nr:YtxH domain-containing protein [Peribacillus asahii]AZV41284.1 hypothetical protein BAOM_0652 [Peribacillus asahii]USK85646.1 YtxH domain-containing protein [Peribacillus asahii]